MAGATVPQKVKSNTEHSDEKEPLSIFAPDSTALTMVQHSPLWEFWYSADGKLELISDACTTICGYEPKHFYRNSRFMEAIIAEEHLPVWHSLWANLRDNEPYVEAEFQLRLPDGKKRWMQFEATNVYSSTGARIGIRAFCNDITKYKTIFQQLKHITWYDNLTQLPNRSRCLEKINSAIARSTTSGKWDFSVVYLDIDRFKNINDSLGHAAGDAILHKLADRLRAHTYGHETVFRLGGDEFAIIVEDTTDHDAVHRFIDNLSKHIKRTIVWNKKNIHITVSFGIMHGEPNVESAERFLQNAHVALNHGRSSDIDSISVYNSQIFSKALNLISMELDLHNALLNEEFFLVYQPVVNVADRSIIGCEALLRWENSRGQIIPPDKFIPLAEETGLILHLGEWVLREACSTFASWIQQDPAFRTLKVNVNLSARQLSDPDLTDMVSRILQETALDAHYLRLEVTETMLMDDPNHSVATLHKLKELGVSLCIDDFGTGYSSLMYLQQFPIDNLKIDRSFVSTIQRKTANYEIVKAVIALARALDLTVVAEGVEEEEQRIMLEVLNCHYAQGYLFSKPISPTKLEALVRNGTKLTPQLPYAG